MSKFLSICVLLCFGMCQPAFGAVRTLIAAATATGAGTKLQYPQSPPPQRRTFQASGLVTASTGACAVEVDGSDDAVNWIPIGVISLTLGTSSVTDGFASDGVWVYTRGNVLSISGTNAACTLLVGY